MEATGCCASRVAATIVYVVWVHSLKSAHQWDALL
jgi:hypothetical protein